MNDPLPVPDRGKILVIDDNPTNLHILAKLLREANYDVRAVTSGPMALTVIPIMLPDLILLDIRMPQMDGYEVCQHLKLNPATEQIPIIFLSALSDIADKVKAFEVGGVDYISKPFRIAEVLARVNTHLSLKQLQQQLQEQNDRLKREISAREQAEITYRELAARTGAASNNEPVLMGSSANRAPDPDQPESSVGATTVLAAELIPVSPQAEAESPLQLQEQIQQQFHCFDRLTSQHRLTKIRTLGTVYLVVAERETHPGNAVAAAADLALAMQMILRQPLSPLRQWQLRIGIHTTSEAAKRADDRISRYALEGEAIVVAMWLQQQTTPGCIQVSATSYDRLRSHYLLEACDSIKITAEGKLVTYWLKQPKDSPGLDC